MKSYVYKCKYFSRNIFLILVIVVALFLGSMNIKSMVQDLVFAGDDTTADFNSAKDVTLVGNGSQSLPYLISSVDDFKFVIKKVNNAISSYQTAYYKLTTDLNFSNTKTYSLGYVSAYFKGTFDGGNNHIKNINVTCARGNCGLFGYIQGATIKNLKLDSGTVQLKANNSSGSLVGAVKGLACTIDNCGNYGVTIQQLTENTAACASGLIGYVDTNLTVTNCFNHATITNRVINQAFAGGIVARVNSSSAVVNISKCYNKGNISAGVTQQTAASYAGGILGSCSAGTVEIEDCYNVGIINSSANVIKNDIYEIKSAYAGGICGFGNNVSINRCYNNSIIGGGYRNAIITGSYKIYEKEMEVSMSANRVKMYDKITVDYDLSIPQDLYFDGIKPLFSSETCYTIVKYNIFNASSGISLNVTQVKTHRQATMTPNVTSTSVISLSNSKSLYSYDQNNAYSVTRYNGNYNLKISYSYTNFSFVINSSSIHSIAINGESCVSIVSNDELKNKNLGTNWAIDSSINNGYPHLKIMYWEDTDF